MTHPNHTHQKILTFLSLILAMGLLSSCVTSRPDLAWTEDGRQFGKASWYDDHGDRTANGEIYNMYALTAAHPSIALNSIVQVTNLRNGKRIKVRVNDRLPPIHEGRVIDLSKAAFRQLEDLEVGLIDVEICVLQYGNNKYIKVNATVPKGKMYLAQSKSKTSTKKEVPIKTTMPVATTPIGLSQQ